MEVQSWTVFANLRNMSTKLDIKGRRKFNTTFLIFEGVHRFFPQKVRFFLKYTSLKQKSEMTVFKKNSLTLGVN